MQIRTSTRARKNWILRVRMTKGSRKVFITQMNICWKSRLSFNWRSGDHSVLWWLRAERSSQIKRFRERERKEQGEEERERKVGNESSLKETHLYTPSSSPLICHIWPPPKPSDELRLTHTLQGNLNKRPIDPWFFRN